MPDTEHNDPHRDLGYLPKSEVKEPGSVQKVIDKLSQVQPSHEEMRKKNFSFLKELEPTLEDAGQGSVSLTILGRQIDFHLPSNTWYSHSKHLFGYNIEKQVRQIQEFLRGKK